MVASATVFLIAVLLAGCGGSDDAPELTAAEEQALLEEAIATADGDLATFVATGVNPCGLEITELLAEYSFGYEDLPSLVNDVDLIVDGTFGRSSMETPAPGTIAGNMPVEFDVDDVLLGDSPGGDIVVGAGAGVLMSRDQPRRYHAPWLDQCAIEQAILFFDGPAEDGRHGVVAIIPFADGKSEADPFRDLVGEGVALEDVKAEILSMIEDQQAAGLPKGRLLCDSRRISITYKDPRACPGDIFNPYEAYALARPLVIDIRLKQADGQPLDSQRDIPTGSPAALALLSALNLEVLMVAGEEPESDFIELSVITATTGVRPYDVQMDYDIKTDSIWVPVSGGTFPAPEGFREVLEALLSSPPPEATEDPTDTPPIEPASTMERGSPIRTPDAPRTNSGPEMRLALVAGGYCEGSDCFVEAGARFTLGVEVVEAPPSYILLQTFIDYGIYDPTASEDGAGSDSCGDDVQNGFDDGTDRMDEDCVVLELTYFPTADAQDELFWTDPVEAFVFRQHFAGLVGHGGLTGIVPPLPESSATGVMVQLRMSCPERAARVPISLLPYNHPLAGTSGTAFVAPDVQVKIIPTLSSINLHCVVP
jgi:hypothetical protein